MFGFELICLTSTAWTLLGDMIEERQAGETSHTHSKELDSNSQHGHLRRNTLATVLLEAYRDTDQFMIVV